jgi:AraC-like DNA-binding protein
MIAEATLALRGLAVGLCLALILAGAGAPRRARQALWPALTCLVAYVLRSAPQAGAWPVEVLFPLSVGALLFPLAFWWLVHCAFDDRADVPWSAWLGTAMMLGAGLMSRRADATVSFDIDGPHLLQKVTGAAFVVAGLWRLWRGGIGDLVAGRRRLRGWLLAYIGAHGLIVLGVEAALRGSRAPAWLEALNVLAIALAVAITLAFMLQFRASGVAALFGPDDTETMPTPSQSAAPPPPDDDAPWLERLDLLMQRECVYRDPELTVAAVATRLGLPEYRLRELIHRRLGHRNFPAFVNGHRLHEVERRLADPACDRLPILTLALEAGFGSVGPFNRAFRERHGMSPSEYRGRRSRASTADT